MARRGGGATVLSVGGKRGPAIPVDAVVAQMARLAGVAGWGRTDAADSRAGPETSRQLPGPAPGPSPPARGSLPGPSLGKGDVHVDEDDEDDNEDDVDEDDLDDYSYSSASHTTTARDPANDMDDDDDDMDDGHVSCSPENGCSDRCLHDKCDSASCVLPRVHASDIHPVPAAAAAAQHGGGGLQHGGGGGSAAAAKSAAISRLPSCEGHHHEVNATDLPHGIAHMISRGHRHGADCGHEAVLHDNHVDFVVDGLLHHTHGDHCDLHGLVDWQADPAANAQQQQDDLALHTHDHGHGHGHDHHGHSHGHDHHGHSHSHGHDHHGHGHGYGSGHGHGHQPQYNHNQQDAFMSLLGTQDDAGWSRSLSTGFFSPPADNAYAPMHGTVYTCDETHYPVAEVQAFDAHAGHELVAHGSHIDYVVDGHLLHQHGDHLDDHGALHSVEASADLCQCSPDLQEHVLVLAAAESGKDAQPATNCRICEKKVVRTAMSVQGMNSADRSRYILRWVKRRHVNNIGSNANTSILKGVTAEVASKLHALCEGLLHRRCRTLAELATLNDAEVKMLQSRESSLFRNLKSFRNSALGLVDLEAQEVSLQKRARNAACCARFREKRKQKAAKWQQTIDEMTTTCNDLTDRIAALESERGALVTLLESLRPAQDGAAVPAFGNALTPMSA